MARLAVTIGVVLLAIWVASQSTPEWARQVVPVLVVSMGVGLLWSAARFKRKARSSSPSE